MAPSQKTLEKALADAVRAVLNSENERDQLTVNFVRNRVEQEFGLEDKFFAQGDWKARSKDIIKQAADEATAEPEPSSEPKDEITVDTKNGVKRQSTEEPSPPPKRVKRVTAPKRSKKQESESELSQLDDSEEEKPKKTKRLSDLGSSEEDTKKKQKKQPKAKQPKKAAPRGKSKKTVISDEDEAKIKPDDSADRKRKLPAPSKKPMAKRAKIESDNDEVDEKMPIKDDSEAEAKVKTSANPAKESTSKQEDSDEEKKVDVENESKAAAVVDDSSELSSVIDDEPPPPKKRGKAKESKGPAKVKASSSKPAPKELDGDEVEIKKLQGQLLKCGVRKIWAFELKDYGSDSGGKIKHLKKMLKEIGMDGRFSEAKAKEIKERRELMADLEAVQEMNKNWGVGGHNGRASRSKAKAAQRESSEEVETEEEAVDAKPRVSKRMADLAFLGDESESE
ncbi:uncharacterized protein BCR38DRAFT_70813 [Pseudomassariella vexata]|uniref:Transcriptional regulator n=1 Tax=Pseudomassariella vexata TaxID=1141098 RepID=A0A1Y2DJ71_9PEZI|nr:uncharacterized protein BCR38DRAFT_70813 [Pseudomassariella vexata]ORY58855.1 hypothetical protein BCR38DRAFT_70813 [Pseudomassariella vexata]